MVYRAIRLLGNRYAGFILCMVVIINLVIGSLVMNMHADLYPPFFPFDLNFFFEPVNSVHSWLYALLLTFSLFAVNLFFCLLESFIRLANSKSNRRKQIAALLIHLALFVTMMAHLQDGFQGRTEQLMITSKESRLTDLGSVRAESLKTLSHPDGTLKDTEVMLQFTLDNGQTLEKKIAYNEPAIFDAGTREVIIQGGDMRPAGIVLVRQSDQHEIRLVRNEPYAVEGGRMILMGVYPSKMGMLMAQVAWQAKSGERAKKMLVLDHRAGMHTKLQLAGETYQYRETFKMPVVGVQYRYNPSIPLILNALVMSLVGLILLIALPRQNGASPRARIG